MQWLALIGMIATLLGPLLEDCAKRRLELAAKRLPKPSTFANEAEAVAALHDKAIASARLPRVKRALARMRDAVIDGDKLRTAPLTAGEVKAGQKLAASARP
jgi:hypothetical protein